MSSALQMSANSHFCHTTVPSRCIYQESTLLCLNCPRAGSYKLCGSIAEKPYYRSCMRIAWATDSPFDIERPSDVVIKYSGPNWFLYSKKLAVLWIDSGLVRNVHTSWSVFLREMVWWKQSWSVEVDSLLIREINVCWTRRYRRRDAS